MSTTTVRWGGAAARRSELEAELARAIDGLRSLQGVVEAWVFGSMVGGGVHATSDLDLLVVRVTDESPSRRVETLLAELDLSVPVDVFVYTPDEAAAGGRFIDGVRRSGRRLL
ncbi:MAG: nucleotidyltransferase domain-containing protein [Actinobacteria bacterium]|nr:nucleotidyltransferase domain-containing protein [Actinomycetota bacterium]